jgi:hypothetical protein
MKKNPNNMRKTKSGVDVQGTGNTVISKSMLNLKQERRVK